MKRRSTLLAAAAAAFTAGCAAPSATRWYELRDEAPTGSRSPPALSASPGPSPAPAAEVWELSPAVALPGALDRDTLMVATGRAGLRPLPGHRWAEPLRNALPRVLLHDLQRLRGPGSTWPAPAPAGVVVQRRLRVQVLELQADEAMTRLRVAARWWLEAVGWDVESTAAPLPRQADFSVAVEGASVDALAAAHRAAAWELARRMADMR